MNNHELAQKLAIETTRITGEIYRLLAELSAIHVTVATELTQPPPEPQPKPRRAYKRKSPKAPPTTTSLIKGSDDSGLLDAEAAAEYIGLKKATLDNYRRTDRGPAYVIVDGAGRHPYHYRKVDLDAWIAANRKQPDPPSKPEAPE